MQQRRQSIENMPNNDVHRALAKVHRSASSMNQRCLFLSPHLVILRYHCAGECRAVSDVLHLSNRRESDQYHVCTDESFVLAPDSSCYMCDELIQLMYFLCKSLVALTGWNECVLIFERGPFLIDGRMFAPRRLA